MNVRKEYAPLLRTQDLSLFYQDSGTPILDKITLEVHAGELILIAGPSGSGKSSLIHCLAGLIPRTIHGTLHGIVSLLGKDIQKMPSWEIARYLAIIFQEPEEQFFTLKVEDELAFGPENHGIPSEQILPRIHQAAIFTDTKSLLPRSLNALSEGEKQRVAIAANLTLEPIILLFDEPTSNLDEASSKKFCDLLLRLLRRRNHAIILIEHHLHLFAPIADRLIILQDGQIRYKGDPLLLKNQCVCKKWGLREQVLTSSISPNFWKHPTCTGLSKPLLSLRHLRFKFHRRCDFLLALPEFSAMAGEAIALVGDNGTGKTTLLRLLAGTLAPDSGMILVQGRKPHRISPRKRSCMIRLVLQNTDHQLFMPDVYSELTFANNSNSADFLLHHLNLKHLRHRHPHALSIGEKQRLAIAAALICEPLILLLDEPTSGMDGMNINCLIRLLLRYKQQGMIIVIASHDIELIRSVCDRGIKL
ncbi:MAG: ABC transporter ATP-binding protein [bacterium]